MKKRFPDPDTKLLVACNNGRSYTMDAVVALDEEGYTNLAALKATPPCCCLLLHAREHPGHMPVPAVEACESVW